MGYMFFETGLQDLQSGASWMTFTEFTSRFFWTYIVGPWLETKDRVNTYI